MTVIRRHTYPNRATGQQVGGACARLEQGVDPDADNGVSSGLAGRLVSSVRHPRKTDLPSQYVWTTNKLTKMIEKIRATTVLGGKSITVTVQFKLKEGCAAIPFSRQKKVTGRRFLPRIVRATGD